MHKNLFPLIVSLILSVLYYPTWAEEKAAPQKNYKDEKLPCVPVITLLDGLYFGAAVGFDSYRVIDEVIENGFFSNPLADSTFSLDPRLNTVGAVGGGFVGVGKNFPAFYNTYLALEFFGNASAAHTAYDFSVVSPGSSLLYQTKVKVKSSFGISLLPGIKFTPSTLFYVRLGYNWSDIEVDENLAVSGSPVLDTDISNTSHGFNYGLGMETAIFMNFSIRGEFTHTDYTAFDTTTGVEITPSSNQFMTGLIFHFI